MKKRVFIYSIILKLNKFFVLANNITFETKETFKHKEFTNNHTDYVVNHVSLCENGDICVKGFKNVFDNSFKSAKRLPNLYFEHNLHSEVLAKK